MNPPEQTVIDRIIDDLYQAMRDAAGREPRASPTSHRGYDYVAFGLYARDSDRILRAFRPRVMALQLEQRLSLSAGLLARHIGELGHAGIAFLALSVPDLSPGHLAAVDRLLDDFCGWSHVDHFCIDVMQPLLRKYRQPSLDLLAEWNRSANPWKRRASVVTFTRKIGESGQYTEEALGLCASLIWDPEDLVQKGVGWALKDCMRGAPGPVLDYVKHLRRLGVSSTITLYAIRDLKGAQRAEVLAVRRTAG